MFYINTKYARSKSFLSIISKQKKVISIIVFLFFIFEICEHNVTKSITNEDAHYIKLFLKESNVNIPPDVEKLNYEKQIDIILLLHNIAITNIYKWDGIPLGQTREPKDLYKGRTGLCFDRSRLLEKMLIYAGFHIRHVAIYKHDTTRFKISEMLTPNQPSHAATEVYTKKGWLYLDSLYKLLEEDIAVVKVKPYNIGDIQRRAVSVPAYMKKEEALLGKSFMYWYGLYSRTGMFYPPFDFIPDYNFRELFYNLFP
jgi:hypothetical protein